MLLMFDEVISGFRASAGGAQQIFGVKPDLTCLGKIIGGGLPVGAYGGRADVMELLAPAGPVYQAGTLSGNPLAMTAGLWSSGSTCRRACTGTSPASARGWPPASPTPREPPNVPMQVNAFGSLLTPFFTDRSRFAIIASAAASDTGRYASFFRGCWHAASIPHPHSSKRGSSPARTPRGISTGRCKPRRTSSRSCGVG